MTFLSSALRLIQRKITQLRNKSRYPKIISDLRSIKTTNAQDLSVGCIIFSKDRPLQLYALLESFFENVTPVISPHVLFNGGREEFTQAYHEVFKAWGPRLSSVNPDNGNFREQLIRILRELKTAKVFFLVDDIIFKNKIDIEDLVGLGNDYIPSLRLGEHIRQCYTAQGEVAPPKLKVVKSGKGKEYISWQWHEGIKDWGYPMSVDGNIFSTEEIYSIAQNILFKAPNSFEIGLQVVRDAFAKRKGIACRESILMNIPCNKVQFEIDNSCGTISPEILLGRWNDGKKIDIRKFRGLKNVSVHQNCIFEYIDRKRQNYVL